MYTQGGMDIILSNATLSRRWHMQMTDALQRNGMRFGFGGVMPTDWLMSVEQRLSTGGRGKDQVISDIEQTLELLLRCGQAGGLAGDTVQLPEADSIRDDLGLEAQLERQNSHIEMEVAGPGRASRPSVATPMRGVQVIRRMRLLMQQLPKPGKQDFAVPARYIHELFEGKWFATADPLEKLLAELAPRM